MTNPVRLAIALDGAGWHPAAWREESSRPDELFTATYWVDQVQAVEATGADFVTIEDTFGLQSSDRFSDDDRTDEVRGRLDASLIAARVAPVTERIGIVPTITTTHTEPFHIAKSVATLDVVSEGRAGWQPRISATAREAALTGRREVPEVTDFSDPRLPALVSELFADAADVVEVVRRVWDSWEDDAEIRDVITDRFIDTDKIHNIDFAGEFFSVRGPGTVPRSPQAQPVIASLAHAQVPYEFAARGSDVVFVTPTDAQDAARILAEVRAAEQSVGREGEPLAVYADIVVFLDGVEAAEDRLARLDALGRPLTSDARIFAGSAADLAADIAALSDLGYAGVRLRPGVLTDDVPLIGRDLVPLLRTTGVFADSDASTLRGRLGLATTVPNRYAVTR